jgi:hypothetical protein
MMKDMSKAEIEDCLAALGADDFRTGPDWSRAHDICQAHEGEPVFDRIHALIHRIEGDDANARYWYRRAGTAPFEGSFAQEVEEIRRAPGPSIC